MVAVLVVCMQWANEDVFNSGSISCNVALRGRREEGGGRDMYVEKESGTVGSTVKVERGGKCRAQNDRWLLQVSCVP